jgi:hypothetical protein
METVTYQKNKEGDLEKTVVTVISKEEIQQKKDRIDSLNEKIKAHLNQYQDDIRPFQDEMNELIFEISAAEDHGVISADIAEIK